jgi:hypothetical protein
MAQPERLYPIKPDEGHLFHAGIIPGDQQLLMGLFCPDLVAFCFDAAGNLLCVHSRPLRTRSRAKSDKCTKRPGRRRGLESTVEWQGDGAVNEGGQ